VCWKPCSSCWSFHLLREEFLSAPIHSPPPLSGSPYRSFILNVVNEDGGTTCSARNETDGRAGLVAGGPKTSWRGNKSDGDVELGRMRGLVSAVLGKGLPFYGRSGAATVIQTS
jgi:hypothetical protein